MILQQCPKCVLTYIILLLGLQISAQNPVIDSLELLIEKSEHDTIALKHYIQLTNMTLGRAPDQSAIYARKAMKIAETHDLPKALMGLNSSLANIKYITGQYDSSFYYLKQSEKIAWSIKDTIKAINCRHNSAVIHHRIGQLDSAQVLITDNIKWFDKLGDTIQWANSHYLLGNICKDKDFLNLALENMYLALEFHRETNALYPIAEDLLGIGATLNELGNYDEAKPYFQESIALYDSVGRMPNKAQALAYLGAVYTSIDSLSEGEKYLRESLTLSQDLNYQSNTARSFQFLGSLQVKQGNFEEAIESFENAIAIWNNAGSFQNSATVLLNLSKAYLNNNQNQKAKAIFEQLILQDPYKNYSSINVDASELLAKIYEEENEYATALKYLKLHNTLKDSIALDDQKKQIQELQLMHELEGKETALKLQEQEINTLNQRIKIGQLQKGLIGGGLAASILFFTLLIYSLNQKQKRKVAETEAEQIKLKQDLAFKEKELTNQTLHLVQKNTFLQKLSDGLEDSIKTEVNPEDALRKMRTMLKIEPELDRDWDNFKNYFSAVHSDFDSSIKSNYPDITENELRLAYLLKMRLNTSEIAAMLHVLPESIRKSKYRLKKKLGLGKEKDLYDHLVNIG